MLVSQVQRVAKRGAFERCSEGLASVGTRRLGNCENPTGRVSGTARSSISAHILSLRAVMFTYLRHRSKLS